MKVKDNYKVIGIMSGTSLDGLDLACCSFINKRGKWNFKIQSAVTLPYAAEWRSLLSSAHRMTGDHLIELDALYGEYIGECCALFIRKQKLTKIDAIASHGHTIFHQPENRMTFQLGNGNAIHAATGLPVVFDFRKLDIALKGQGAPLVPAGDRYLFPAYDVCVNLGGIANVSMEKNRKRIAFDVCFVNMGMNYLARHENKLFDEDGLIARRGIVNISLRNGLRKYYSALRKKRPALGREGFESNIRILLDDESIPVADRMRTFCESVADEIALAVKGSGNKKIIFTGGGALNPFLMDCIQKRITGASIELPTRQIIEFKEAMVFAFLAVLRLRGEVNVLKSVTRATRDSCSGVVLGAV